MSLVPFDNGRRPGSDPKFDRVYYSIKIGAPQFDTHTAKRLGNVIARCLPTQVFPAYWNVPDAVSPQLHGRRVMCHKVPFRANVHPFKLYLYDSSTDTIYHLCEFALHDILAASHLVTEYKEWLGDKRRRKNMKAPQPKAQEFADLPMWKEHGADKKAVEFVITAEPTKGEYGFVFPITIAGKTQSNISMKEDSKKYLRCHKLLGDDFGQWVGKPLTARVEEIRAGRYEGEEQLVIVGLA